MKKVVIDPLTLAKLASAHQEVELCDDSGHVFGRFIPLANCYGDAGREPRINNEEIERRLRSGGGRSLAEILADLEKKA